MVPDGLLSRELESESELILLLVREARQILFDRIQSTRTPNQRFYLASVWDTAYRFWSSNVLVWATSRT